jgi:hypothetical protein
MKATATRHRCVHLSSSVEAKTRVARGDGGRKPCQDQERGALRMFSSQVFDRFRL